MTVFAHRNREKEVNAASPSIGLSPVAGVAVAPISGFIQRVMAAPGGTTTGTITVAVAINGGSDIANSLLTIAPGSNARAGTVVELNPLGSTLPYAAVSEGDCITFTPSGGGGSSISGAFGCVIRRA
jgi:hypothetical protein